MSAFKKKVDVITHATKLSADVNLTTIQEITKLITDKLTRIQGIVQRTLQTLNQHRNLSIISNSDLIVCTSTLIECFDKTVSIIHQISNLSAANNNPAQINQFIDQLQQIIDKLSIIMCGYGAYSIEDILFISFGIESDPKLITDPLWRSKYELITKYVKPIGYKTFHWKQSKNKPKCISEQGHSISTTSPICANKIVEEAIQIELANQYECFEIDSVGTHTYKNTYIKIHGIRVVMHNEKTQKTLVIQGIVEDVPVDCIDNAYIKWRMQEAMNDAVDSSQQDIMRRLIDAITIKESLICGNEDFHKKRLSILIDVGNLKLNKLTTTLRKFVDMDVYGQRAMLTNLLIYNREDDIQYITYLLYDLISAKPQSGLLDSNDQQMIYDSFPWRVKLYFKEAMKNTIKFTKEMSNKYDINRISLEQQIYVLKVPENVKEKAMSKFKEIKSKSDDSGAKAKQYLEGLLKIPFGVFREETILKKTKTMNAVFLEGIARTGRICKPSESLFPITKSHYSALEISKFCDKYEHSTPVCLMECVKSELDSLSAKCINQLYSVLVESTDYDNKSATVKSDKIRLLKTGISACDNYTIVKMFDIIRAHTVIATAPQSSIVCGGGADAVDSAARALQDIRGAKQSALELRADLKTVSQALDESIYGHEHAKNQILKIMGQWMNGEQSGYCFGFEGSPGVGKTSLAKHGLANCLNDDAGISRPFAFIALGGSCNGSTLEGHSYTYVNSTWGRIIDVLMDAKCMNPIIYIDELDKVSKTEHGKEIIGILMHLIDTTQNTGFQDKYFSGIDIDLSKALFIFSYNDPSQIDSILLDRIHRIKFENLALSEKLVIARKYILPEINKKMGLEGCVYLSDKIIEYIVETYTLESGVRKLKEVIFDLHGEINIELLRCDEVELPIEITIEALDNKYLTKYDKITAKKIHKTNQIGIINGLWANALGRGGIIPIQAVYFPTTTFLELKLTGMQGDVMKESMNVAKSMAWSLLDDAKRAECLERFEKTKEQGIHIHCPDGATPKDGPSAGAAITIALYSLLSGRQILHNAAMTGEINLQGKITEIGGLEQKILGGIKAGVTKFLYPHENQLDLNKVMEKYGRDSELLAGVAFYPVSHISDTFEHLFV